MKKLFLLLGTLTLIISSCSNDSNVFESKSLNDVKNEETIEVNTNDFFINKKNLSKIFTNPEDISPRKIKVNQFFNGLVGYCLQPGNSCAEDVVVSMPKFEDYQRLKEDINYIHISDLVKRFKVEGYEYEISVTPKVSTIFYHFKNVENNQIVIPFKY